MHVSTPPTQVTLPETVVFVHGVLMTGLEMSLLRQRVARCGYDCRQFRYPSRNQNPRDNARALQAFLQQLPAPTIHLVGHSLGGIVLLHLFEQFPEQKPGKVVMLGSPLQGSSVARQLARHTPGRWLLGRSLEQGLLGGNPDWNGRNGLGMLAGCRSVGIGRLLVRGRIARPNDGTVALDETRMPALARHKVIPHSHFGMLFAPAVARDVCHFLRHGEFAGDGVS